MRTSAFVHVHERSAGFAGLRSFRDALHTAGARALAPVANGFVFRRGMRTWTMALDPVDERFLLAGTATSRVLLFDLRALDAPSGSRFDASAELPPVCVARALEPEGGGIRPLGVTSVAWYPLDGGLFVSSSLDGRVRVWDGDAFTVVSDWALGAKVFAAGFSRAAGASHALVAAATAGREVRLCDLAVGAATHSLLGHRDEVWSLAWSPESEFQLASGARDGEVRLWDIRRSGATACLLCLNHEGAAAAPGRATVLTNVKRPLSTPSLSAAARPAPRKRHRVDALQALAAGGRSANSSSGSSNSSNSSVRRSLLNNPVRSSAPARRNDPHAAASVSSVTAHLAGVNSLAYTPDGRFLLSSGLDQKLRLWNSKSGEHQFTNYEGVQSQVAARSVQMAVVQEGDAIDSTLVFHPNGRDGQLNAYQVFGDHGAPLLRATAHYSQVTACVYRHTTRELFTGGEDGIIMKWQPPPVDLCPDHDGRDDRNLADGSKHVAGAAVGDADAWSDDEEEEEEEQEEVGDVFIPPILRHDYRGD